MVTEYYEERRAGWEFEEFVRVSRPKRLLPILIGRGSPDVWNRLKEKALVPQEELVYLDLTRDGLSGNDLTTKGEDELKAACRAAVEFVRNNATTTSETKPGKRPGVVGHCQINPACPAGSGRPTLLA
ncbi:hypothetical protein ACFFII_01060 [Paracoccus niistensis]|uniref:Uncharacterized protein n=1 Tax=Paracoccus niistensis TaxID=632935 RepID=A0ABV6I1J9_9RHOB